MIYHCDLCDADVYIPGNSTDPVCPDCRVSRTRENVRNRARKELRARGPSIAARFGEGGRLTDIALVPEGREYIGWVFAADSDKHTLRKVRYNGKSLPEYFPKEIEDYFNRVKVFNTSLDPLSASYFLHEPGKPAVLRVGMKTMFTHFESVHEDVPQL